MSRLCKFMYTTRFIFCGICGVHGRLMFCAPRDMVLSMKVVHKNNDEVLQGMLRDELDRCQKMMDSLRADIAELPKGSVHQRKRNYKGKISVYHYRKFREAGKSVYEHIPADKLDYLKEQIEARRKKDASLKKFVDRSRYLERLLKV